MNKCSTDLLNPEFLMIIENVYGKRIFLRKVKQSDADILTKWKNDSYFKKMALDEDSIVTLANQQKDIDQTLKDKNQIYYVISLKESNQPVGYIRINWISIKYKMAWLRFGLGDFRGQGYGEESLKTFLNYWFDNGLHRVEAEVYEYNLPSIKLLTKLNFRKEGEKKKAHFYQGNYYNMILFGLLKEDYQS